MRIRTTIWLGMFVVTLGYVITVVAQDIASRSSDAFLDHLAHTMVPASHASQAAVLAFNGMIVDYEDGVVSSDPQAVGRATNEGGTVVAALNEILALPDLPAPYPAKVAGLSKDLVEFLNQADPSYRRIATAGTGTSANPSASETTILMHGLSQRTQALGRSLVSLEKALQGELNHTISTQHQRLTTQRLVSDLTMIALLVAAIASIALLTARWSTKLHDLIGASRRLAQGDYDTAIEVDGTDEVGQLGGHIERMRRAIGDRDLSLRVFNDTLEQQIGDRTRELEERNRDLSTEIAERHRIEANLRAAHEEAEAMLASLGSALIGIDGDDHVTRWNQAAERLFGKRADEVLGKSLAETGIRCDWAEVFLAIERCMNEHQPIEIAALRYEAPHGETRWMSMLISPSRSQDGNRSGRGRVVLLATDITQHRLEESQAEQHAKLETIGQLASGIAHEINTPIQFIGDNLRFLSEHREAEQAMRVAVRAAIAAGHQGSELTAIIADLEQRHDMAYLDEQAPQAIAQSLEGIARVAEIIQAMKTFSHPDQGSVTLLDLNAAIRTTIEVCRNEYKYVADVRTNLDPDLPPILCQSGQIHQVILNLIVNAAQAIADIVGNSERRGTITITTTHDDKSVVCTIADTGTGIPVAVQPKIFTPFFTTKAVGKGTGQGLHIAYNIIEKQHRGRIQFTTQEGSGTAFSISLPRA